MLGLDRRAGAPGRHSPDRVSARMVGEVARMSGPTESQGGGGRRQATEFDEMSRALAKVIDALETLPDNETRARLLTCARVFFGVQGNT